MQFLLFKIEIALSKERSFIEEYEDLLKEFEIDYDERFVFKPVDYIVPDGTS